jgi:hypothetical protein
VLIVNDEFGILAECRTQHINHGVKNRSVSRIQGDDVSDKNLHSTTITASKLMSIKVCTPAFSPNGARKAHVNFIRASPTRFCCKDRLYNVKKGHFPANTWSLGPIFE